MGLKINGSTSGSIEIDVPAVAGANTAITIPATTGGEFIVSDASGNVDLGALDISGSASADSVVIDSAGRLLVGTSSTTAGQLLTVQGSIGDATGIAKIARTDNSPAATAGLGILDFSDSGHVTSARIRAQRDSGTWTSGSSQPSALTFSTTADGGSAPTERMRITSAGDVTGLLGPYNNTIATGTNLHITAAGTLKRVTSSAKYKTSIETLEDSYADNILNCRPVWYRALGDEENPEYSWYGFIAEEVAEIDPRLVQYRGVEVTYDEDGSPVTTPLAEPVPEGVSYERFVPHLLNLIKRQKEQIESQATQLASLEARLTALEGGAS